MRRIFIYLVMLLVATPCQSQSANKQYSFAVRIYPQYLLQNGFRADVEKCFYNQLALYVGPHFYTGLVNANGGGTGRLPNRVQSADELRNGDQISGYGFNAGLKWYINSFTEVEGKNEEVKYFIGADMVTQSLQVKFNDYDYYPFYQDGLQYYTYDIIEKRETIRQYGCNGFIGVHTRNRHFCMEGIFGVAYRRADIPRRLDKFRDYNRHYWDYGYSNFAPYCLLSFGVFLF